MKETSKGIRGKFAAATASNDPTDFELETDPIQTDSNDSKLFIDNEDAIIFDLKRGKKN